MLAASNGHSDTVKLLIDAGADIEAKGHVSKRERERKRITKRNTNRLREWRNEKKKRIRVRVRDKMKTPEERKTEKQ